MLCRRIRIALHLLSASASVLAFSPAVRRDDERSWTPARQTGIVGDDDVDANQHGWSPRPTPDPRPPRFGEVELFKRVTYSMGTDTCGFVSGYSSAPVTCVKESAYCTNDGVGNMDCCTGAYSVCTSSMYSACLDYSASQNGACSNKGPRTICCWSASPSCFTLIFSTSATPGRVFSILECQSYGGLNTLYATPPALTASSSTTSSSRTTSSSSSSSSSTTTTTPTPTPTPPTPSPTPTPSPEPTSSPTPVGAIVGGVVGGVAVIALVGFAIFYFVIRARRGAAGYQAPPQQQQVQQTHPGSGPSPGPQGGAAAAAAGLPSSPNPSYQPYGVSPPPQHAYYDPQGGAAGGGGGQQSPYKAGEYGYGAPPGTTPPGGYNPHASVYGGVPYPPPGAPGTSPGSPPGHLQQQQQYDYGYPQQQQQQPPPPGQYGGAPQHEQQPVVNELPANSAVGTDGHRAELH